MAINYPKLFGDLGKGVKASNNYGPIAATTLPNDLAAIITQLGTGTSSDFGITKKYAGWQQNVVNWRKGLGAWALARLSDVPTVLSQLNLSNPSTPQLIAALIQDMQNNAQSVANNTVTVGAPTLLSGTQGTGTVLMDTILDGFNIPVQGGFSSIWYNKLPSELAVPSETQQFLCVSAQTEGAESWQWTGGPQWPQWNFNPEGSGGPIGIVTAHGATILNNLSFSSFSSNVPTNWTIDLGTAGTNVKQDSTAPNIFRAGSACLLLGDGVTPTIQISQGPSLGFLNPRQRFCFTIRMKQTGAGAGLLTIKFTSASGAYVAAGSEQISLAANTIPGTYTLYSFYLNMPATVPSDLRLAISLAGTQPNTAKVWVDSGSFAPVTYFDGVDAAIVSGLTPWATGDRITVPVSNNSAGLFQEFFRRQFYSQLPSSGVPTLSNALAS